MKGILDQLSGYGIILRHNWRNEASFSHIALIGNNPDTSYGETLYIGYASDSPSALPDTSACLLIDDGACIPGNYAYALFQSGTDPMSLYNDCVSFVQADYARRRGYEKLLQALTYDKGLAELVRIGAEILGNPMMVMDSAFNLLAVSTREEQKSAVWMDMINNGCCSEEHVYNFRRKGNARLLAESNRPVVLPPESGGNPRGIAHKITYRGKTIGYIGVLESNRPFTESDLEMVEQLSPVFSAEMRKTRSYDTFGGGIYESFILGLLSGKNESQVTAGYLKAFSENLYNCFYVAVIPIPRDDAADKQVQYLRTRIENSSHRFHTASLKNHVVVLISLRTNEDLAHHLEKLNTILEVHQLSCGLSFGFENLHDLKKHYREALRASRTGLALRLPGRIYSYEDVFIYDLLMSFRNETYLESCVHPALKKVEQYDSQMGTDYFTSLYKYLRYGGNITLAAKDLNVHRNTMVHRVNKLRDITGLDLDDCEVRTRLMLAFKILELTKNLVL